MSLNQTKNFFRVEPMSTLGFHGSSIRTADDLCPRVHGYIITTIKLPLSIISLSIGH